MSKITFVDRVLARLKGGDDLKVVRFASKLEKYIKEQIRIRRTTIEEKNDLITDKKEALEEYTVLLDKDRLASSETINLYVPAYVKHLDAEMIGIKILEDEVEGIEEQIERLQGILDSLDIEEAAVAKAAKKD